MINDLKKNCSTLPAGKYGNSTKQSTRRHHQTNRGRSGLEFEMVSALGALRSSWSKKKFLAEDRQEMHFASNEEKEKWIEDYVERETAVATKLVQDTEKPIMHGLQDMTAAENVGATTRTPQTMFQEMLNAFGDSLSDLVSSDDEQSGEDEEVDEDNSPLGKLSDDDETGLVMGKTSKTVQLRMESFRLKQMRFDELTQPGWEDAADYFRERDMKYGTAELKVPAVFKPHRDTTAAAPSPTTFGEHMQPPDIVHRQELMQAVTCRPGSSQMRLGSEKPQSHKFMPVLLPDAEPEVAPIQDAKPVELISFYPCMMHY